MQLFVRIGYSVKQQIADMPMYLLYLISCKFFGQIIIMYSENSFTVTVVNMYLQAFALLSAMIPCRFNISSPYLGILVAYHCVIELFAEIKLLAEIREYVSIVISFVSKNRKCRFLNR